MGLILRLKTARRRPPELGKALRYGLEGTGLVVTKRSPSERRQRLFLTSPTGVGGLVLALVLAACEAPAERQAAENARIQKQAAKEINRICALPMEQREAELEKIKEQSGMVLYCGNR